MINRTRRLEQVIKTEATDAKTFDFLLSHVQFDNLFKDESYTSSVSEDDLLNDFATNNDRHRFMLIQGSNGSGKSHLIRWMRVKYDTRISKEREAVLLISRAHNTLKEALLQIYTSDIFPQEIKEKEVAYIQNTSNEQTGDELKKTVIFNFTLEIDLDLSQTNQELDDRLNKKRRAQIKEFLQNELVQKRFLLVENGPIDRIKKRIEPDNKDKREDQTDEIFTDKDFDFTPDWINRNLQVFDNRASQATIDIANLIYNNHNDFRKSLVDYLNTKTGNVIKRSININTSDFKELFAKLRIYLKQKGMGLTLFIEDINSFSGIDEALMEVLIANHEGNEMFCRLKSVVGSTTAFYNEKLNESIKERITDKVYLSERSIFGSKEKVAQFAAKYINAVNTDPDVAEKWFKDGADDNNIPVHKDLHKWAEVEVGGNTLSIYPFNDNALWNLYNQLSNDKKTPRVFIKEILKLLLVQWYSAPERFLKDEEKFRIGGSLLGFNTALDNKINNDIDSQTALQRGLLLKIWGDRQGSSFFKQTGKDIIGGVCIDIFNDFEVPINMDMSAFDDEHVPDTSNVHSAPIALPTASRESLERYKIYIEDVNKWSSGESVLAYQQNIREIVIEFLSSSIYWAGHNVPDFYVIKGFSSEKHITFEDSGISIPNAFVLQKNQDTTLLLTSILQWRYLGNRSWNFSESDDLLVIASSWIVRNEKKIVEYILGNTASGDKAHAARFIVASMVLLRLLKGNIDFKKICKMRSDEMYDLITELDLPIELNQFHSEAWVSLESEIRSYSNLISSAFISYFSKATGTGVAGETTYRFIDFYEVQEELMTLEKVGWDFTALKFNLSQEQTKSFVEVYNLLRKVNDKVATVFDEETAFLSNPIKKLEMYLNGDLSEDSIKKTAKKCTEFLDFLSDTTNHSYRASEYDYLNLVQKSDRIDQDLVHIKSLSSSRSVAERISIISTIPTRDIISLADSFTAFDQLLSQKETQFKSIVDPKTQEGIIENKNKIEYLINHMDIK